LEGTKLRSLNHVIVRFTCNSNMGKWSSITLLRKVTFESLQLFISFYSRKKLFVYIERDGF